MKTLRLMVSVFIVVCLAGFNSLAAQTHQIDLHAEFSDGIVWCLGKTLSGSWTYHVTYHVDKKTGEVDRLHWNIKHCNLWDSDGNKYRAIDTGNDNIGAWWDFFNNINFYNALDGSGIVFDDPADGFLDPYWPGSLPVEGSFTNMFKFVGNGEVVSMRFVTHLHMNAHGEITADISIESINCD